ncbi:Hypothetical predicted protein [Mytilus galloprovincialis]|uniref:Uncharacterized protein n=1 Tax=Mytilus galloprovincialis TaxID=29158 RepID=A0A8B6FWR0_MYTGA|nr:Hypothetical predicted protein [Mytilus galloprovincialis]
MAFIEDSLLRKDMGISHHDEDIEDDEELSPTLENLLILTWLRLIHPKLPKLIKQRYGTELRERTLASIMPEMSQALKSHLEELRTTEDAKSMRAAVKRFPKIKQSSCDSSANGTSNCAVRKTNVTRAPSDATTLWPGDYIDVKIPTDMVSNDDIYFIEPHKNDSYENLSSWPEPSLVSSVAGNLRIPNLTDEPLVLKRNEHFCNVRSTYSSENNKIKNQDHAVATKSQLDKAQVLHSDLVGVDPGGLLQPYIKGKFKSLLRQYDNFFSPTFKGYNGAVGAL